MLIYFHKNKLSYEKGQLAPFFILILVVLLLMAMVTVNLSKVAFIKTDSSNAADSGALASGSVMANVFNAVASLNSQMEALYWDFYAAVSFQFTMALTFLTTAYISAADALTSAGTAAGSACSSPCAAVGPAEAAAASAGTALKWLATFIKTTLGIVAAVSAFQFAQYYFYLSIRDMAENEEEDEEGNVKGGRQQAIKLGHNFAFINSGIGSKLKEGSPLAKIVEPEQKNNYRNEFSRFLDQDIGHNPAYTYTWKDDKQERSHSVTTEVDIDKVDTFDLQVTLLPLAAELALLGTSLGLAYNAEVFLTTAEAYYAEAVTLLGVACDCYTEYLINVACCGPHHHACCVRAATYFACFQDKCVAAEMALATGIDANSDAISDMTPIFGLMAAAWAGLWPGPIFTSDSKEDVMTGDGEGPLIICWIDDIMDPNSSNEPHNRLVRVDTTQQHQGVDLGLWQTRYPATHSYAVVNFEGQGKIHASSEDDLRHDASIRETDSIGSP